MSVEFHIPHDRYYDARHHVWIQYEEETASARIGIDTLGLDALGELAYVELVPEGTACRRGSPVGTLEAQKMTSPLLAPVSGTVRSANPVVLRDPTLVNSAPYTDGWLLTIHAADWATESRNLIHGQAITPWVESELARYREEGGLE